MFKLGPPVQIAYAVNDAREAASQWAEEFGAGPFFLAEHIQSLTLFTEGTLQSLTTLLPTGSGER